LHTFIIIVVTIIIVIIIIRRTVPVGSVFHTAEPFNQFPGGTLGVLEL
jgi:hypothetical protein